VLFNIASPAYAKYGGGTGEPNDPYLICDANHMNTIGADSNDWDKHFLLCADIDLSSFTGTSFNIIGYWVDWGSPDNKPFTGVFDGNDHTISNFTYTSTGINYVGLFGYVLGYVHGSGRGIKNLGLIDPNVDAGTGNEVGSLVARLHYGTITGCYVKGGTVSGNDYVGGLVGLNSSGAINNCYSTSSVSGENSVGGLMGLNWWEGTINNCYSTGSVSGENSVGGLVGYIEWANVLNCYSTGDVSGDEEIGGLVGENWDGTITNSYSTGSVSGTGFGIGGLIGNNFFQGQVTDSFWDIETSGQTTSAGGTGLPTAEMQTATTFIGWACEYVWTIDEGNDYPRLWWENAPGEPITTPSYGGGSGEPKDPYLIYTAEQLNTIGLIVCDWNKHFKLMADIDLVDYTGTSFNIIGTASTRFTGTFDANSHTISNFTYASAGTINIGLFGYVRGEVRDLGLIDPNVNAGTGPYVGALVGRLSRGTITNCYVEDGSVSGNTQVGGLVGRNYYGTITNSYSIGDISGGNYVGGLVGYNYYGTITNSYSIDDISGGNYVGGLVGYNNNGTISNCYSEGDVSGNSYLGGLVGVNFRGRIANSYWDIETSHRSNMCGVQMEDGTGCDDDNGKTTAEMQMEITFTDAGWDFVGEINNGTDDFWTICEAVDYPKLTWQFVTGDFDGDDDVDFTDFAMLATRWLKTDSIFYCGGGGTDLTIDGDVDFYDLKPFAENWLAGL
jgi:hypothetical protein